MSIFEKVHSFIISSKTLIDNNLFPANTQKFPENLPGSGNSFFSTCQKPARG